MILCILLRWALGKTINIELLLERAFILYHIIAK